MIKPKPPNLASKAFHCSPIQLLSVNYSNPQCSSSQAQLLPSSEHVSCIPTLWACSHWFLLLSVLKCPFSSLQPLKKLSLRAQFKS